MEEDCDIKHKEQLDRLNKIVDTELEIRTAALLIVCVVVPLIVTALTEIIERGIL